jgi:tripeptidyl-peptidase-1
MEMMNRLVPTNQSLVDSLLTVYQTVPEKYAKRVCNLIGLNTLRGLTFIHSSGDEGEKCALNLH